MIYGGYGAIDPRGGPAPQSEFESESKSKRTKLSVYGGYGGIDPRGGLAPQSKRLVDKMNYPQPGHGRWSNRSWENKQRYKFIKGSFALEILILSWPKTNKKIKSLFEIKNSFFIVDFCLYSMIIEK